MHTKYKVIMAAALVTAFTALEGVKAGEASFGVDAVSAYVFRGGTINDEVNLQPYGEGSFGAVTVGTWGNYNTDISDFDEIDYYGSVELPLEGPIGVSLGYTFYTYPLAASLAGEGDAAEAVGADSDGEVNIGLAFDTILSPSLGINVGVEGGIEELVYLELGLGHDLELSDSVSASIGATAGIIANEIKDSDGETGVSFVSFSAGVGTGPVSLGVTFFVETDDEIQEMDEEVVGTLSLDLGSLLASSEM